MCGCLLTGCAGSNGTRLESGGSQRPVTVREDVVYESPYTELRRVEDNKGNVIRYERRSKPR
jgi:hypothetical protein